MALTSGIISGKCYGLAFCKSHPLSRKRRRRSSAYSQRSAWSASCCTGPLRWNWTPSLWTCTCCWSGARPPYRWFPSPRTPPTKHTHTHKLPVSPAKCCKCVIMTPNGGVPAGFDGGGGKRRRELVQRSGAGARRCINRRWGGSGGKGGASHQAQREAALVGLGESESRGWVEKTSLDI